MPPPIPLACLPRSAEHYKAALDSLAVETNPRYKKRDVTGDGRDETWCNFVVADACELLGVHIPKGLRAREQVTWLGSPDGKLEGWFECVKADADAHADQGHPTVVGWINPDPKVSSHVAMLRSKGRITQAGSRNYNDAPLVNGFGARTVSYFVHL